MIECIMTTYDRLDLLEQTIDSFNNSINLPNHITIFDDCSKKRCMIQSLCEKIKIPYELIFGDKHTNCSIRTRKSLAYMFDFGTSNVFNINSDSIFNKYWWTILTERYMQLSDNNIPFGALSLYNYSGHKIDNNIIIDYEKDIRMLKKRSIGIFGCLVTRCFWEECIKYIEKPSNWEYKMSKAARLKNIGMYCTTPSYIQHTGINRGTHDGKHVYAKDFLTD